MEAVKKKTMENWIVEAYPLGHTNAKTIAVYAATQGTTLNESSLRTAVSIYKKINNMPLRGKKMKTATKQPSVLGLPILMKVMEAVKDKKTEVEAALKLLKEMTDTTGLRLNDFIRALAQIEKLKSLLA